MPALNKCPQCGAPVEQSATTCKYCGEALSQIQTPEPQPQYAPQQQMPYGQQTVIIQQQPASPIDPSWPVKSKIAAGVLGILLGGLGIHKFYLGKVGMGILYLVFCWTCIPSIVGLVEGIIYLTSSDHNFQIKHHVRVE